MKNVKEFEIKVEGEKWTKALDKAFKSKNKELKVDGFRKGCCPKDVYLKKFGIESLYMDAVDLVINDAYRSVIEDNNLNPVCEPSVDIAHICENDVTFKFTAIEKPEVKLSKYTKLGVKKEEAEVTEEDVNHEIMHLQERFADIIEVEDGVVEEGTTAVIDFEGTVDGEKLEGGTGANYPLEIGSHTFIPGFEEGLVGMSVGEEKTLNLTFPEDYVDNLKGKDVEFKVKVTGLKKRVLPELNEDFYKDLGYENVKTEEEFKEKVKAHILEHKEADAENKYIDALIKKAIENIEVELNPEIIDAEIDHMLNRYRDELRMQGLTLEQYLEFVKSDIPSLRKMMEPEATNNIKGRYVLEEVASKENLEATEEDINEEVKKAAEMYQVKEEEFIQMVGGKEAIAYELKMRKAIDFLKNN